jgi:hypothetical protein
MRTQPLQTSWMRSLTHSLQAGGDVVRFRYDRIRSTSGRVQTVVGDVATQGERMQAVLSWRDPRATLLSSIACVAAALHRL